MHSLALATSSQPYLVELTSEGSAELFALPVPDVLSLQKRLLEVAEIAAAAGDLGFVMLGEPLELHVADSVVRYTVSDAHRTITVTGIAPALEAGRSPGRQRQTGNTHGPHELAT
jgi:hypothetical protein